MPSSTPGIGAFAVRRDPLPAATPCSDIARLFGRYPDHTGIIVEHPEHGLCVLDRHAFEARMSGPSGFGMALDRRTPVGDVVEPRGTVSLPADAPILAAYQALVDRPRTYRDYALLVHDLPGGCVGLAGTSFILETIASLHADLALYDDLTGLRNRKGLMQRIDRLLEGGVRGLPVLFLDLDRFKVINDSLGHEVGDRLLRAVAERLQEAL